MRRHVAQTAALRFGLAFHPCVQIALRVLPLVEVLDAIDVELGLLPLVRRGLELLQRLGSNRVEDVAAGLGFHGCNGWLGSGQLCHHALAGFGEFLQTALETLSQAGQGGQRAVVQSDRPDFSRFSRPEKDLSNVTADEWVLQGARCQTGWHSMAAAVYVLDDDGSVPMLFGHCGQIILLAEVATVFPYVLPRAGPYGSSDLLRGRPKGFLFLRSEDFFKWPRRDELT